MGLKTKWIVVRGMPRSQVLDALGVVETGEIEGLDVADMAVADLGNGWVAVHWGDFDELKPAWVAGLFPKGEIVFGSSSETVMWSIAHGMRDGETLWTVKRDSDAGHGSIFSQGDLPPEFAVVCEQIEREEAESPYAGEVDFVFEVPAALAKSITGYDPARQNDGSQFHVVAPRLTGAAGKQQAEEIKLRSRLEAAVSSELVPLAESLGFEPLDRHPDIKADYPAFPRAQVRVREGRSDVIYFSWGLHDGLPGIAVQFFVHAGERPRFGTNGIAHVPPTKRGFLELFTRRNPVDPEAAFIKAVADARELVHIVDRYLKTGASHPNLHPPRYETRSGG